MVANRVWEECFVEKTIPKGSEVILALMEVIQNSTALVALSMEDVPHLEVLGHWARPVTENKAWKFQR